MINGLIVIIWGVVIYNAVKEDIRFYRRFKVRPWKKRDQKIYTPGGNE